MTPWRAILFGLVLIGLAGCGSSKFRTYDGPEVTRIIIKKTERQMYLLHDNTILNSFDVGLGFAPEGHKQYEGDGRTPVGHYLIDKRNPDSLYHLSVGISYPNQRDVEVARALGRPPGGDIFIHGRGPSYLKGLPDDWTAGCIAVTDKEIERIYAMVKTGTPVSIYP